MYLRHATRRKDGKTYTNRRLVRSARNGRKVRQETVAQLGELDGAGRVQARLPEDPECQREPGEDLEEGDDLQLEPFDLREHRRRPVAPFPPLGQGDALADHELLFDFEQVAHGPGGELALVCQSGEERVIQRGDAFKLDIRVEAAPRRWVRKDASEGVSSAQVGR